MTHLSDKATDKEVLEAAITKAFEGGWQPFGVNVPKPEEYPYQLSIDEHTHEVKFWVEFKGGNTRSVYLAFESIVFSPEFVKTLFGDNDEDRITVLGETDWRKWPLPWQYHLQQLAVAEDRIDYLRRHLDV